MKTKTIILRIALESLVMLVCYLIFAFVLNEIDFRKWSESARVGYILFMICASAIYAWYCIFNYVEKSDE